MNAKTINGIVDVIYDALQNPLLFPYGGTGDITG
jgi:hypothetical protein